MMFEEQPSELEIIAEIGVNHDGNLDVAGQLVAAAAEAGATTAKFQVFRAADVVTKTASVAEYQKAATDSGSQFDLLRNLELSYESFVKLKDQVESCGMRFLATPDDYQSLRFLIDVLGVDRIKVGSGEVTHQRFLEQVAAEGLPVILSTGMSNIAEITSAIDWLGRPGRSQLNLLHCTSSYPTGLKEANVRAIETMQREFQYPIGFSDHTEGFISALLAYGMGSRIFEKHLTLSRDLAGPDHQASADPADFRRYVVALRDAETAIGSGHKVPTPTELINIPVVRRRIVAARALAVGQILAEDDVVFLRADSGIMAEEWGRIRGVALQNGLATGESLEFDHVDSGRPR